MAKFKIIHVRDSFNSDDRLAIMRTTKINLLTDYYKPRVKN